jgi:WD40 repeat protein
MKPKTKRERTAVQRAEEGAIRRRTAPLLFALPAFAFFSWGTALPGSPAGRTPRLLVEFPRSAFTPLAFSRDNRVLAIGRGESVSLVEVATRRERASIKTDHASVTSLLLGNDARCLVTAEFSCEEVKVWDLATDARRLVLKHSEPVRALALSPDGKTLAAADERGTVQLWELATGKELATLRGPKELPIYHQALAFSPDGKTLAVGGGSARAREAFGEVRLWDVPGRRLTRTIKGFRIYLSYVDFSRDGKAITAGSYNDPMRTWRLPDLALQSKWKSPFYSLYTMAFSPGGDFLVAGGAQPNPEALFERDRGELRFLERTSGKTIHTIKSGDDSFRCVAFSPDGRYLATAAGTVSLWDVSALGRLPVESDHMPPVRRIPPRQGGGKPLTAHELEALWGDLASAEPSRAYRALWKLTGAASRAVPFLRDRLKPAAPRDDKRIAHLVSDLGSDVYQTREKATQELERMGDVAGPALRRVMTEKRALEWRKRVEKLLRKLDDVPPPERLRALRAVEALELMGTIEACRLLAEIAEGTPEDRLTREARQSLWRLSR